MSTEERATGGAFWLYLKSVKINISLPARKMLGSTPFFYLPFSSFCSFPVPMGCYGCGGGGGNRWLWGHKILRKKNLSAIGGAGVPSGSEICCVFLFLSSNCSVLDTGEYAARQVTETQDLCQRLKMKPQETKRYRGSHGEGEIQKSDPLTFFIDSLDHPWAAHVWIWP